MRFVGTNDWFMKLDPAANPMQPLVAAAIEGESRRALGRGDDGRVARPGGPDPGGVPSGPRRVPADRLGDEPGPGPHVPVAEGRCGEPGAGQHAATGDTP